MADAHQTYFHECLVAFITAGFRLSTWHWTSSWNNFHAEFQCPGYEELTPIHLKGTFMREVLPNILTYDLPAEQREKVNLLETYQVCGPKINRTERGYNVAADIERVNLVDDPDFPTLESGVDVTNRNALVLLNTRDWDRMMTEADGHISIRKCVSLCLQTEKERLQETLLSWSEIKTRWANKHELLTMDDYTKDVTFFEEMNRAVKEHFQKKSDSQRRRPDVVVPDVVQSTPMHSSSRI